MANKIELKNEVLNLALQCLKKEIEKEPISSERVTALTNTIEVLAEIGIKKKRTARKVKASKQHNYVDASHFEIYLEKLLAKRPLSYEYRNY